MSLSGFTDYLSDKILNHLRGNAAFTMPAGLYVGLFSAAPTAAGGGTEVTTTIRVAGRLAATFGAPSAVTAGRSIANTAAVDYGASAGAASVTHFGVFDAASAGNLLWYAPVPTPLSITTGINVSFAIGALTTAIKQVTDV